MDTYLDIETSVRGSITVIGILNEGKGFLQLIGNLISTQSLLEALKDTDTIYTYNGTRFDIPVIKKVMGVDLRKYFHSHDLMYDCWRNNLYGGLKKVETRLGIHRNTVGIDGSMAMKLWDDYIYAGDQYALQTLLQYNREDVYNLVVLRRVLRV